VELLRRYSNRPELVGPLVSVMEKINNSTSDCNEIVTNVNGRTASPHYIRTVLTDDQITEIIASYKAGTTAKILAERHGVHYTTIKKKLRMHGVRRNRP
jgi:hypothetical protein